MMRTTLCRGGTAGFPGGAVRFPGGAVLAMVLVTAIPALAQSPAKTSPPTTSPTAVTGDASENARSESPNDRRDRLARYLTGASFEGSFTIDAHEETAPKAESYTITSCEPLAEENRYRLKVKIRYGDVDGEFPMDLDILWAGATPVITLDAMVIPGLGTFSSRVVIHNGRYAGTWQHGASGGHLFGKITPAARNSPPEN